MYFIDVQGTLISDEDKSPLEGSREFIDFLNKKQIPYVVLTNNSKDLYFLNTLKNQGFDIKKDAFLDPLFMLKNLNLNSATLYGPKSFKKALKGLGIKEEKDAKTIIFTNWEEYTYTDFALMIENNKADFIAMNATSIYVKDKRSFPGCGSICKMLKYACNPSMQILGKPSFAFFTKALELLKFQDKNADFSKITLISDDFRGDLVGGEKLGLKTCLVLSGKIKDIKALSLDEQASLTSYKQNINELLKELKCKN